MRYLKERPVNATGHYYVWYREHRHISDYISFTTDDLFNPTFKKITSKSNCILNIGMGFDCETSKENPDSNISHVYIWQFTIDKITFISRDYNQFLRFVKELSEMIFEIHPNTTANIFIANIKYEYSYFKELLKPFMTDVFAKSKTDIVTFTVFGNLLFRECLGVFGTSLSDIAKSYCTTQKRKGDIDHTKIRTPHTNMTRKEILYSVCDTVILSELWQTAFNEYLNKGKTIPLTQTGIVRQEIMNAYCPFYKKRDKLRSDVSKLIGNEELYLKFRNYLYSGGLTHSNFAYVGLKLSDDLTVNPDLEMHIKCADLTSAYPWALSCKYYPTGQLIETSDLKELKKHKHFILELELHNIESKSTHSTISKHKCLNMVNPVIDNGRIYKADSITVMVSEIDLSNIKEIYKYSKDSKIIKAWYFTDSKRVDSKILKVLWDWYRKKQLLKPHKDDSKENAIEYMTSKQKVNSIYGMFVTQVYTHNYELNEKHEIAETKAEFEDNIPLLNPYIGYWCTAYVRQRLINCISRFPESIVQYDTDSIYWNCNDKDLENYIDETNMKIYTEMTKSCDISECLDLGQWDKEDGDYPLGFMGLGSKRYIGIKTSGKIKITFAGANENDIKSECKRLNMDIFDYLKNFEITTQHSNKKGAVHSKNNYYVYDCTDYKGNTYTCESYGYTTIVNVPFKAFLSAKFLDLKNTYATAFNYKGE